ncbi:hypothetical protein IWZ00DRAFT_308443 [Phyllosticta capitalensis]|uniref:Uncharacterized protein n=1 Tax=Phyllosticta capitalensis TaxID=121624 RepID=A0ABR1YKE9_9PEZI
MAGPLPDELIVKIAEHLVEQVEPQQDVHIGVYLLRGVGGRVRHADFKRLPMETLCGRHAGISPLTLALFSPVLLDEYIKILLDTKVFHFHSSASLYAFINTHDISEAALQRRRSIRFLRLSRWGDCDCGCRPWRPTAPALSIHGYDRSTHLYDRSLGPAIRLMPRVATVHVDKYEVSWTSYEAAFRLLTALQPVLMRSDDLSTVFSRGHGKQSLQDRAFEREYMSSMLRLFDWAKNRGLLDMMDMDEFWTYTCHEPNPWVVLRQVWRENDCGRRTEPPEALLRRWNEIIAEDASKAR